jgi:hypothetical protein
VAQRRPERAILLGELLDLALADSELVTQDLHEVPACVHLWHPLIGRDRGIGDTTRTGHDRRK